MCAHGVISNLCWVEGRFPIQFRAWETRRSKSSNVSSQKLWVGLSWSFGKCPWLGTFLSNTDITSPMHTQVYPHPHNKNSHRKEAEGSNRSHGFKCATYVSQKKSRSIWSTKPQIECSCWLNIPSIMLSRPVLIKRYHMHVRSLRVAVDQTLFVSNDIAQMGCTAAKASPHAALCREVEASARLRVLGWFWESPSTPQCLFTVQEGRGARVFSCSH